MELGLFTSRLERRNGAPFASIRVGGATVCCLAVSKLHLAVAQRTSCGNRQSRWR
jgi:hypothetical protein